MYISKLINPEQASTSTGPALYYLPDDPQEMNDVLDENIGLATEIHERHIAWLKEIGTTEEYLCGRLELR
jgi:hypothetical protein